MDIRENITWLLYNEEASQRADIAGIFEIYSEKLKVRFTIFRDPKHISRRAYISLQAYHSMPEEIRWNMLSASAFVNAVATTTGNTTRL